MLDKESKEGIKLIAIAFAEWIDEECVKGTNGYFLTNGLTEYDTTEYQINELYDYWLTIKDLN